MPLHASGVDGFPPQILYSLCQMWHRCWFVSSGGTPEWLMKRDAPSAMREPGRLRYIPVRLKLLPMAALLALCAYTAFDFPAGFHLPVIGAGAYSFVVAIFWPLKCSRVSVLAFAAAAVAVNLAMVLAYAWVVRETTGVIAVASTLLFTGAIGLLLVVRTREKPSRRTKVSLMAGMVTATLTGPVMYLFIGADEGVLGGITSWLLIAALPFLVLTLGMFLVLSSYHESEQTLPSDKWV